MPLGCDHFPRYPGYLPYESIPITRAYLHFQVLDNKEAPATLTQIAFLVTAGTNSVLGVAPSLERSVLEAPVQLIYNAILDFAGTGCVQ